MKSKKIVIGILLVLLVIAGIEGLVAFFKDHSYYASLFTGRNVALIGSATLAGLIPLFYVLKAKKFNIQGLGIKLGIGLGTFSILHAICTKGLATLFAIVPLTFNTVLLFGLAVGFLLGIFAGGNFLVRKLKIFQTIRWQETLLTFGTGLIAFLVLMQLLMGIQIFYSILMWGIFLGLLALAWRERKHFKPHTEALITLFQEFREDTTKKSGRIFIALFLFSVGYYFFNFVHSYIPYSTARDANHEYMYVPKVIAENAGILRGNNGPAEAMPYLWHGFISFFFSLWAPLGKVLNIAKDTVAVNLNALSGVFVLLFGLGAVKEALSVFKRRDKESTSTTAFLLGWGLLLLWLTSGMGAFLVFVDNKTDMGVLALSILALLGGLTFLRHLQGTSTKNINKQGLVYLFISSAFFAFAVMAKPTAFIDAVIFGLILVGLWLNGISLIGGGIALLGLLGIIQPLFTAAFITPALGKVLLVIGGLIALGGGIWGAIKKSSHFLKYFKVILLRGVSFLLVLALFKAPWVAVSKIVTNRFHFNDFVKSTLLGQLSSPQSQNFDQKKVRPLLAQGNDVRLEQQSTLDRNYLNEITKDLTYDQCHNEVLDKDDLESSKQKAPGNALNEDVGRYVGFSWRAFEKTGVGGGLLKLLFWKNNSCFGRDRDGLLLCQHREAISKKNLEELRTLALQLSKQQLLHKALKADKSPSLQLLESLLEKEKAGEDLRDAYKALETYYQEHSILTTESSVMIPYRYIVPLNIVFNWSLQNLSSYYTDIGPIWFWVFIIFIGGLIYVIIRHKTCTTILLLSLGTLCGWAIWWAIGGGILRYGLGLIIWSILVLAALFQEWEEKNTASSLGYSFLIGLFAVYMLIQAILNSIRIASQASEGPFSSYRSNVYQKQWITDNLEFTAKMSYAFRAKDIFELQFGQYQPFLQAINNRKDDEGILIAGTYLQYFLNNHKNLVLDGMLSWFWEEISDFNSCRSYQRLKNNKLKYLVIDPNIGTVGRMGEGNESLFHRFFARLNSNETTLQTHGAITMLIKMAQEGYIKLIYTNNLGAKYAFDSSDEELTSIFGKKSKEELLLLRAKMAVAKFFFQEDRIMDGIFKLFQIRILNGKGLGDTANLFGKKVDEEKMLSITQRLLRSERVDLSGLDQEERLVLAQYIGLFKLLSNSNTHQQAEKVIVELLKSSLFGSSQIITLELK